jgi:hypothetical protein
MTPYHFPGHAHLHPRADLLREVPDAWADFPESDALPEWFVRLRPEASYERAVTCERARRLMLELKRMGEGR